MTDTQAAYIAALIDGEGTVGLCKTSNGRRSQSYAPKVNVSNTNLKLLNWLLFITKVGVIEPTGEYTVKQKQGFRWRLRSNEMKPVLERILPYLVIKQRQAELILEYLLLPAKYNHEVTEAVQISRAIIFDELAELNQRGL